MRETHIETFDCRVTLPDWRVHVAHLQQREGRDLGNVIDVALRGAAAHVSRRQPSGRLAASGTLAQVRESIARLGIDPERTPPCSELLLARILEQGKIPRSNLPWEFLNLLVAKSEAPWSVLDREALEPPLVFRAGGPGERLALGDGLLDCKGLPVLADGRGIQASPWTPGEPSRLEGCTRPVFVCYLPRELFRSVQPKNHIGRAVWLTFAYEFLFERTFSYREES